MEENGPPEAHSVLEFVRGRTLDKYIRRERGAIPYQDAIPLLSKIIEGIGYAHEKEISIPGFNGVLHLDIKPANILISNNNDVKILDYGISQGTSEQRSQRVMGSVSYMSPEQLDTEQELDRRTDIYAIGVVLHHMITGRSPCYSEDRTTLDGTTESEKLYMEMIESEPLTRVEDIYRFADPTGNLQYIIDKATKKDPENRFQNCEELLEEIQEIQENA